MTELSDDEAMAAEYVLGTLDGPERAAAEVRRTREPAFESLVAEWEARLVPLAEATPASPPPPDLLARVLRHLPAETHGSLPDNVLMLRQRVRVWRGLAGVATALAAALALWIVVRDVAPGAPSEQNYVAVLQHGADQPSFMVAVDLAHHRMSVVPIATDAPPGKSYELWMIGGKDNLPHSMGVIDPHETMRPRLPDVDGSALTKATYAVTLEPQGGSPTGQPTSAPLFLGKLVSTSL